jgi:hypothetical protein
MSKSNLDLADPTVSKVFKKMKMLFQGENDFIPDIKQTKKSKQDLDRERKIKGAVFCGGS